MKKPPNIYEYSAMKSLSFNALKRNLRIKKSVLAQETCFIFIHQIFNNHDTLPTFCITKITLIQ